MPRLAREAVLEHEQIIYTAQGLCYSCGELRVMWEARETLMWYNVSRNKKHTHTFKK